MNIRIPKKNRFLYVAALFIGVGLLLYSNSMHGEFIGDDIALISYDQSIHVFSWKNITHQFNNSFFKIIETIQSDRTGGYYRPLVTISYLLDYAIWGEYTFGYHFTNVCLHIACALLLYFFLKVVSQKELLSFITAFLFLIHPIHSPHIASISGRTDLLCLACMLLAICAYSVYVKEDNRIYRFILGGMAILFFIGAMLSKEVGMIMPALFIIYDICFLHADEQILRKRIWFYICAILSLILFIVLRCAILSAGIFDQHVGSLFLSSFIPRLLTAGSIFLDWLQKSLIPIHIDYWWRYVPVVSTTVWRLFGLCFLIVCIVLIVWYSFKRNKLIFFGATWCILSYVPAANIIPVWAGIEKYNLFVGKQFFHIPLVGVIIVYVAFFEQLYLYCAKWNERACRRLCTWFFITVSVSFMLLTPYHNIIWISAFNYNMKWIKAVPDSIAAHNDIGLALAKEGYFQEAEGFFKKAIMIAKEKRGKVKKSIQPFINLQKLYRDLGMEDKAQQVYNDYRRNYEKKIQK